jgi:hypothetical protein
MAGSWSNTATNLIILIEQISGYSGIFGYSPAPGPGDLVLSVTAAAGTDPYGNAYEAGVTLYSADGTINLFDTHGSWTASNGNSSIDIEVGPGSVAENFTPSDVSGVTWDPGSIGATIASRLGTDTPLLFLSSPTNDANPSEDSQIILYGAPKTSSGDVLNEIQLSTHRVWADADTVAWVTTGWIKAAETWHTPTFAANWASTGTLNGNATFRGMQYRHDAEDNVWILGAAVANGAGASVFTLPAGYRPPTNMRCLLPAWIFDSSAGTTTAVQVQVTEAGVVNAASSLTGITIAAGDQLWINGKFPLGNV